MTKTEDENSSAGEMTILARSTGAKNLRLFSSWFCPCAQVCFKSVGIHVSKHATRGTEAWMSTTEDTLSQPRLIYKIEVLST